jgi:hypothetical protein
VVSRKLFLIDEGAVVVAEFDSSENLAAPIITVNNIGSLKPGDTLKNKGISAALEIVRLMNAMNLEENIRISEISIDKPPNIFMVAERSGASILLGSGDFEGKLWRLARVADAIARDESLRLANLERMDMRFRTIVPAKFRGS